MVYIAEAHTSDEWQVPVNEAEGVVLEQHRTLADRRGAAARMTTELGLTIPWLIDAMDDAAAEAFSAWPDRIYIIAGGKVAYQSGPGPRGFTPGEARTALEQLVDG